MSIKNALLRDPDRRQKLGREGRARAAEKRDWERITHQYEHLYENVIAQPI